MTCPVTSITHFKSRNRSQRARMNGIYYEGATIIMIQLSGNMFLIPPSMTKRIEVCIMVIHGLFSLIQMAANL